MYVRMYVCMGVWMYVWVYVCMLHKSVSLLLIIITTYSMLICFIIKTPEYMCLHKNDLFWDKECWFQQIWGTSIPLFLVPNNSSSLLLSYLRISGPLPHQFHPDMFEGRHNKLPDGVHLPGGEDEVVGFLLLQHQPHTLYVILGVKISILNS